MSFTLYGEIQMAFASHLGPWLLGTVKNTTGTTAGTIRNMGATVVSQTATLTFSNFETSLTGATSFVLPAGALINHVTIVTTTVFSAATTLKFDIGVTDFTTTGTITSVGGVNVNANATTPGGWLNVGATDAIIRYTATKGGTLTTGAATITIMYTVRNDDGAANPSQA
jgi:hypothetical protein